MNPNFLSILPPVLVLCVAFSFRNVEPHTVPFRRLPFNWLFSESTFNTPTSRKLFPKLVLQVGV